MGEFVQIGNILKAHGVDGTMRVGVEPVFLEDAVDLDAIFLESTSQEKIPYFIETVEAIAVDTVLIKLEDINGREQVTPWIKSPVWARAEDLSEEIEEHISLEDFIIIDNQLGEIGRIEEVVEIRYQELAKVIYENKEILIPLHDDLITKLDESSQKIFMNLPEGLIEVF